MHAARLPDDLAALVDTPLPELVREAGPAARPGARQPHHVLAEGVHPAHHAVPRPLRVLHVRQAARPPRRARTSSLDEVLAIARRGAEVGCREALFTLGEAPEDRYPVAAEWLADHGYTSTVDYLVAACRLVLDETGLLPHANAGALPPTTSSGCARCRPSQGMMIETLADRLGEPGGPHVGRARQDRRAAPRHARGRRASPPCRSPPGSSSGSARPAPSASTRWSRSATRTPATGTCRR